MPFLFQQPAALKEVEPNSTFACFLHPLPIAQLFCTFANGSIYNRFALCPLSFTQPKFLKSMSRFLQLDSLPHQDLKGHCKS